VVCILPFCGLTQRRKDAKNLETVSKPGVGGFAAPDKPIEPVEASRIHNRYGGSRATKMGAVRRKNTPMLGFETVS
jgi:hypothetical protein